MTQITSYLSIALLLTLVLSSLTAHGSTVLQARDAHQNGRSDEAIARLQAYLASEPGADALQAAWLLADILRASGRNREALKILTDAQPLARTRQARTLTELRQGGVWLSMGQYEDAQLYLRKAKGDADSLSPAELIAVTLDLGNVMVQLDELGEAASLFSEAEGLAASVGDMAMLARSQLNKLRLQIEDRDLAGLQTNLKAAQKTISKVAGSERAVLFVSLGELYQRSIRELERPTSWRKYAYDAFISALAAQDIAVRAFANGFLGSLYEDESRIPEALTYTRKALFLSQQQRAAEQTYRWEWQLARLLLLQGELAEANDAYERAVEVLNGVKPDFVLGSRGVFDRRVAPVYTGYADVMLQRSALMQPGASKQAALRKVRTLLEDLKKAEVEDYFANECVTRKPQQLAESADPSAAVFYPVLLEDRIELLVETRDQINQFTMPVGKNQVTQAIRRFRVALERSNMGERYLDHAQALHAWLIKPAEKLLQGKKIRTLVFVPEGPLRTIPLAALHDGEKFLIAEYAVVVTPAIQLTEQLIQPEVDRLLVGGVSESVQGFVELPSVPVEIAAISALYPSRTIQDQAFQLETVLSELQTGEFSVAHFATHGEFSSDHRRSFILTYDDRLTMQSLQTALQGRDQANPLDLLVLSACKTAAGDDRAALGLAGVAVQSGAQSALASLWYISDRATAELINEFYAQLKQPSSSKAQSLQRAQMALIESSEYSHPSYWAPYLLVGNWL